MAKWKKGKREPAKHHGSLRAFHITVAAILAMLVITNMVAIFRFSSESKEESSDRSTGVTLAVVTTLYADFDEMPPEQQDELLIRFHKPVRKLAHFSEYALLGFLFTAFLLYVSQFLKKIPTWATLAVPPAFCLVYAITDEVHQIFSRRGPAVTDVLIDLAGAVCGIALIHLVALIIRKICRRRGKDHANDPLPPDDPKACRLL